MLRKALFGMLSVEGSAKRLDPEVDCAGAAMRYVLTMQGVLRFAVLLLL